MEFNLTISVINMVALIILHYMVGKSDVFAAKCRQYFLIAVSAVIVAIFAEAVNIYALRDPSLKTLHMMANSIGFSITPTVPVLIGCAIGGKKKNAFAIWLPALGNMVATFLPFGLIFQIAPDNTYHRGSAFWIVTAAYGLGLVFLFYKTYCATKQYQNANKFVLYLLYLFLTLGTSIQITKPQIHTTWLCISLALGLYYAYYCELVQQLDGLTGLLNRRSYDRYLRKINGSKNAYIVFFDIDSFKKINDGYGHLTGDRCLNNVASCIRDAFFEKGLCYRVGGDEFCVICRQTNADAMKEAKELFLKRVDFYCQEYEWMPTVSIGYTYYDKTSGGIRKAVQEADEQMYAFKEQRKRSKSSDKTAHHELEKEAVSI